MSRKQRPAIKRLLVSLRHLVLKGTLADWAVTFLIFGIPAFFLLGVYRAGLAVLSELLIPIALSPLLHAAGVEHLSELTWRGVRLFVVLIEFAQVAVAILAIWLTRQFLRSLFQR